MDKHILPSVSELIDTCWDVNLLDRYNSQLVENGINRYMLGCKFGKVYASYWLLFELIDTCWDVNVNGAIATWRYLGINRYMLGCK